MSAARLGALVALLTLALAAPAGAQVPNPAVEGPIQGGMKGYPRNASLFDLQAERYTEREFFYGGTAKSLARGVSAPYKSRMLVRLPQDPAKFNGTVVVEWLNVTGGTDLETVWPPAGEYMMRNGFGYVAVSAQLVGVCCGPASMKAWDPQRYGSLLHPGDEFSYDIFSQSIEALRDPAHNALPLLGSKRVDPMGGLKVNKVVANGASQSASRLTTFVNQHYNRGGIDAFQITRGGGPFTNFEVPIFQLNEENQGSHPPDSPKYSLWEEAGTAHAPTPWWNYVWAMQQRDDVGSTTPDAVGAACSVNRGNVDYSARAGMYWTQHYLETGEMPPPVPRIQRTESGDVARDEEGLAIGGVRHPFIEVPVAYNSAEGCPLWGTHRAWPAAKIKSLYPTHEDYVAKVTAWADEEVAMGWLLPEDRDDAVAKAQAFDGPWVDGSCYDRGNGDEAGPFSSQLASLSHDPSLPLGTGTALRSLNCDALVPLGL
jgi:hypothetical protein